MYFEISLNCYLFYVLLIFQPVAFRWTFVKIYEDWFSVKSMPLLHSCRLICSNFARNVVAAACRSAYIFVDPALQTRCFMPTGVNVKYNINCRVCEMIVVVVIE